MVVIEGGNKATDFFNNIGRAFKTTWNKQPQGAEKKALNFVLNTAEPALLKPISVIAPPVGQLGDAQRKLLASHYNMEGGKKKPKIGRGQKKPDEFDSVKVDEDNLRLQIPDLLDELQSHDVNYHDDLTSYEQRESGESIFDYVTRLRKLLRDGDLRVKKVNLMLQTIQDWDKKYRMNHYRESRMGDDEYILDYMDRLERLLREMEEAVNSRFFKPIKDKRFNPPVEGKGMEKRFL